MAHLRDKSHPSPSLKEYRFPLAALRWNMNEPFEAFVRKVQEFARGNNLDVPSSDDIENVICSQIPKHECTEGHGIVNRAPSNEPGSYQRSGGCKSCGGRK